MITLGVELIRITSTSPNGVGLLEFGLALQMERLFPFSPWSTLSPNLISLLHGKMSIFYVVFDTIKELMSYPKCRSVKVINNPVRMRSIHRDANYINYK
jgi:hypothetical protein